MDEPDRKRPPAPRKLEVPASARGMRLDRFLSRYFPDYSRSAIARGVREGLVTDPTGHPLRPAATIHAGQPLLIWLPGIAPRDAPPPLPPIVHEDDRVVVLDKPAGMLVHPVGNDFAWAVITLAKQRWPAADLAHRIDRDTSGLLLIAKDADANRSLKASFHGRDTIKEYDAIAIGAIPWESQTIEAPIGPADGPIRIQMAVRDDGQSARTDVTVVARREDPDWTRIRCRLHTGRTHQIRLHLAHVGHRLLGDRMYGVAPELFLHAWEHGVDDATIAAAGAPHHALHSARIAIPHPDGGVLDVSSPFPADLARWWADPSVLPYDLADSDVAAGGTPER
jgi:23S rRNA pseudouridine1911/1915/1917 synthase